MGTHTIQSLNRLQVVTGAVHQRDGDGALGVSPREGEGLAGLDIVDAVGELNGAGESGEEEGGNGGLHCDGWMRGNLAGDGGEDVCFCWRGTRRVSGPGFLLPAME